MCNASVLIQLTLNERRQQEKDLENLKFEQIKAEQREKVFEKRIQINLRE